MIAITTENGTLRIAAEIPIPHGQNWSPIRIRRLMEEIELQVFLMEQIDQQKPVTEPAEHDNLPARKPSLKSSLVVIDPLNDEEP